MKYNKGIFNGYHEDYLFGKRRDFYDKKMKQVRWTTLSITLFTKKDTNPLLSIFESCDCYPGMNIWTFEIKKDTELIPCMGNSCLEINTVDVNPTLEHYGYSSKELLEDIAVLNTKCCNETVLRKNKE